MYIKNCKPAMIKEPQNLIKNLNAEAEQAQAAFYGRYAVLTA